MLFFWSNQTTASGNDVTLSSHPTFDPRMLGLYFPPSALYLEMGQTTYLRQEWREQQNSPRVKTTCHWDQQGGKFFQQEFLLLILWWKNGKMKPEVHLLEVWPLDAQVGNKTQFKTSSWTSLSHSFSGGLCVSSILWHWSAVIYFFTNILHLRGHSFLPKTVPIVNLSQLDNLKWLLSWFHLRVFSILFNIFLYSPYLLLVILLFLFAVKVINSLFIMSITDHTKHKKKQFLSVM